MMTFLDLRVMYMTIIRGFLQVRPLVFQKLGPIMVFLISDFTELKYVTQLLHDDVKYLSIKRFKKKIKEDMIENY